MGLAWSPLPRQRRGSTTAPRTLAPQRRLCCGSAAEAAKHSGCHGYRGAPGSGVLGSGAPGASGKREGMGEDKGTGGEKGEEARRVVGWPGRREGPRARGWKGQERTERGRRGRGASAAVERGRRGDCTETSGPSTPLTRRPRHPDPPSPVAKRRSQHPAGEEHARGRGGADSLGRRPLCHLCALETQTNM